MRLKILLVGPCKSGKTRIANLVSEAVEENNEFEYRPTHGVRILEYEPPSSISSKWVAELWDCSGDAKCESCWPAFQHGAHAAILVIDSSKPDHVKSAEKFSQMLANRPPGFNHSLVLLTGNGPSSVKLTGAWADAKQFKVDIAKDGGQALRREVASFMSDLAEASWASKDREEFSLIGIN
ncbi:intraflagellar transport protein 22 homolog [Neocloeon triangulifer]|uniref:intraflagellar transport protein 22 homolog n=1 Tax=Neocloeon triangulifer TaxID=2078957 RepID=UPI00286F154E|nr:intraflagellar transport protein 22 homolog [Neocloeon triangulifer]